MTAECTSEKAVHVPPVSKHQAFLLLGLMWFANLLNYCDRQAVFAMFPSLKTDLSMSDAQLGLTGAFFLWIYALGCPVAGFIGDRASKRALVVLSLTLWSLVTLATGMVKTGTQMLTLRAAMGVSESLFLPTAIALVASVFLPATRSRAIAFLTTAQIAGTIAGSWFGGWMADHGVWRGAFLGLGAVGLLYAIPYFLFLRRINFEATAEPVERGAPINQDSSITGKSASVTFTTPTFLVLCIVFPIFVFGLWLLYGWLPTFLHDKFKLTQAQAAFNATLFLQGCTAIGLMAGGWIADLLLRVTKASRFYLSMTGLLLCAPSLYAIGNCVSLGQLRLAAIGFGLFSGLLMGNIFAAAFEVVPKHLRATAIGVLNLCGGLVSGFATWLGGQWKATLGIDRLLEWTACAYLVAGLLLLLSIRFTFAKDSQIHLHSQPQL